MSGRLCFQELNLVQLKFLLMNREWAALYSHLLVVSRYLNHPQIRRHLCNLWMALNEDPMGSPRRSGS